LTPRAFPLYMDQTIAGFCRGSSVMGKLIERVKGFIAKRGPGVDSWILCLVIILVLPLAPMAIEDLIKGTVSDQTGFISAAMYSISIGLSSTWKSQLGLGLLLSFIFSGLFGFSFDNTIPAFSTYNMQVEPFDMAFACISLIFVVHAIERFIRHVIYLQPFPPA
jgi:hypothetical protein